MMDGARIEDDCDQWLGSFSFKGLELILQELCVCEVEFGVESHQKDLIVGDETRVAIDVLEM